MLEAARWAPSSYNSQPWRFIYARRGTPHFDKFLGSAGRVQPVLGEERRRADHPGVELHHAAAGQGRAGAVAQPLDGCRSGVGRTSRLQATLSGWHAHGMVGFDMERAFAELGLPAGYRVEQAIAVGRRGRQAPMLPEAMAAREQPKRPAAAGEGRDGGDVPRIAGRDGRPLHFLDGGVGGRRSVAQTGLRIDTRPVPGQTPRRPAGGVAQR